jgi:hypothetical protein
VTPDGTDAAVIAAARAVADAAFAFSRLQLSLSSRIDRVNRPLQKANYLLAHQNLRNARRRHAEALGMASRDILHADTQGPSVVTTKPVRAPATDIPVGE